MGHHPIGDDEAGLNLPGDLDPTTIGKADKVASTREIGCAGIVGRYLAIADVSTCSPGGPKFPWIDVQSPSRLAWLRVQSAVTWISSR